MPPIVLGVDPRWQAMQQERRDRAMSDILDSIALRRERDERKAASAGSLFFDNPDLIGTEVWNDWASRNQDRFGDQIAIGEEMYRQRQERETTLGDYYNSVFRPGEEPTSRESLNSVEPGPRDQVDDLFSFTQAVDPEPKGIMPGIGAMAPEFYEEGQRPSTTPTADAAIRIRDNPWSAGLPQDDRRALLQILASNKGLGVDIEKMTLDADPALLGQLQPNIRNLAALMGDNPQLADELESGLRIEAGTELSAGQQSQAAHQAASLDEQTRYHDLSAEEQRRYHDEQIKLGWFNATKPGKDGKTKEFDPVKFAQAGFGSQAAGYDEDTNEELKGGAAPGMDEQTWRNLGQRVGQVLKSVPEEYQEGESQAAMENFRGFYDVLFDAALENMPDQNMTRAKVLAQSAIKLYAAKMVATTRAGSKEVGDRLEKDARQLAMDIVMGVHGGPTMLPASAEDEKENVSGVRVSVR